MNLIGNLNIKKQINMAIQSARIRNRNIPHMLFAGVAGCGKTSTAEEIAKFCNVDFIPVAPEEIIDHDSTLSILETINDIGYDRLGNVINIIKPTIIFLDEIHKVPIKGQEALGMAMERFLMASKMHGKYVWLPYFTIIGATTNDGLLSKPFRDRFKFKFIFEPYSIKESIEIVGVHAERLKIAIEAEATIEIANRGRGIPRIIVGYLENARDMMLMTGSNRINKQIVNNTFKELGIDGTGLTTTEIKILKILYDMDDAIGLDNLAIIVNEAPKTIALSIEPYLIQRGLITRSNKGRKITKLGKNYIEDSGYKENKRKEEITATYVRN